MTKVKRIFAAVAVASLVLICIDRAPARAAGLTQNQLMNTVYVVPSIGQEPDSPMAVKNGKAKSGDTSIAVISAAIGDLSGDHLPDGASIFAENTGGSGCFMYVAAFLNRNGKPKFAASHPIGDRSVVNNIKIKNGQIILDMLAHGPNDPAISPTMHRIVKYKLVKNKLVGPDVN